MTNRTALQDMHIANVQKAKLALLEAKQFAKARARAAEKAEIAGAVAALDHMVRIAADSGISKLAIRRDGLGTQDARTLDEMLKRTEQFAEIMRASKSDPLADRYAYDPTEKLLTIRLGSTFLSPMLSSLGWKLSPSDAVAAGFDHALFTVFERTDGSLLLDPVTHPFVEEYDKSHPVVAWAARPENEAEAISWVSMGHFG